MLNKKTDVVGFYKLKAGKKAGVGKAYLTYSGALTKEFFGFEDDASRVAQVNVSEKDICYYDMLGRCVEHPLKGLYIANGKKVFIK